MSPRKMIRVFLLIVMLLVPSLTAFSASAATVRCDNCSASQMEAAARARNVLYEPTYVVDVPGNRVVKYFLEQERDLIPGQIVTLVIDVPAEAEVAAFVNEVHQASKNGEVSGQFWPDHLPRSVIDDMTDPAKHNNLQAYMIGTWYDLSQRFLTFLQGANPVQGFNPSAFSLTLTVKYADGSKSTYRYDPASKKWERVKGSERDSNGNHVPLSASDFTGEGGAERRFNFEGGNQQDLINFLQRASQHGIRIIGTTGRLRFACATVGGVTECRAVLTY